MKKFMLLGSIAILFMQCGNKVMKPEVSDRGIAVKKSEISSDSLHSYATATKKLLMKNVAEQMQKGGPESALEYCNIEAMPLTKLISDKHGFVISRVSDQRRNPKNVANAEELK